MRHYLLWNTLTLLGTTMAGTMLWADTPVKPAQASFPSPASSNSSPPKSVPVTENVQRPKMPDVEPEKKVVVDYTIKAASIEVAWLQDPITYPLHLRAEPLTEQSAIALTGYVPNDRLREKAVHLAKKTVGQLAILDQLVVVPQMALNFDAPLEPNQVSIVQDTLEKAAPGIGKALQVSVEPNGLTTVSGRVDEFADRLKLIHALQGIPGCTAIRYDLRVYAHTVSTAAPVDAVKVPFVVVSTPAKVAPSTLPEVPKQTNAVIEFLPVDTTVPLAETPGFPKLLGPVTTAKQPSPSLEEIERNASRTAVPATTIVQTSHQQKLVEPVRTKPLDAALLGFTMAANSNGSRANDNLAHSSVSGLYPPMMPGRTTMEPGIQLGTPVIVRTSFESDSPKQQSVVVKSSELTKSSTTTAPAPLQVQDSTPIMINIMPRLAK